MRVKWNTGVSGRGVCIKPGDISDSRDPSCPLSHAVLLNYAARGACDVLDDEDKDAGLVEVETAMVDPAETAMKAPAKARRAKRKAGKA